MQSLDRLGWAVSVVGRVHGVRIGIRTTDPSAVALVRARLPPAWRDSRNEVVDRVYSLVVGGPDPKSPNIKRYHVVYADFARLERQLELAPVMDALESDLAFFAAQRARRRVYIQAGVVGWKGKALLLPGGAASGKSTLVAALVRAGATYYSDAYAVLDARGRVHPYPRPLTIRGAEGLPVRVQPETLGAVGTRPLPVGLVVASAYKPGARWRPRALTPGQAAMALLAHALPARHKPQDALAVIARVLANAPALKGTRGEADEIATRLLARVESALAAP